MTTQWGDTVANAILGCYGKGTNITAPANFYAECSTTEPNSDGTGVTPVVFTGYARANVRAQLGSVSARQVLNGTGAISFGTPSAAYSGPAVSHLAFYDAAAAGNYLGKLQLDALAVPVQGVAFQIGQNGLTLRQL